MTERKRKLRVTFRQCCIALTLALSAAGSHAEDDALWLETRVVDKMALLAIAGTTDAETRDARIRANLTLADHAINQSVPTARAYLVESGIRNHV